MIFVALTLALTSPQIIVIDGDTLKTQTGERIRLLAVDTPEIRGKCRAEKMLARLAKTQVQDWVSEAQTITIERQGKDRYGRTLARVKLDGVDLSDALIAAGLATKWPKPKGGWC